MTTEQFDRETCRLRYAMTLAGCDPREVAEAVEARESERGRLLRERDQVYAD